MKHSMNRLLSVLLPAVAAATAPSVTIDAGTLHGGRCANADTVFFKSVPFAQPPIGDLRFEPPQTYGKYPGGVLNATQRSNTCIQFNDDFVPAGIKSEDCLYLNVYAPASATQGSKLPVKVFVFGGSDTSSGISFGLYEGCNIVDDGTIFVALNYRLGPLGFMALDTAGIHGNQGIQDLLMGLQWVQDNIEAFGGDKDKVLLFGQSTGAEDVFAITSLPQAPSLMNSAIMESGAGRNLGNNAVQQKLGASYAQTLNCSTTDKACLQSKTAAQLKTANDQDKLLQSGIGVDQSIGVSSPRTFNWYPTVDGITIKEQPLKRGSRVPSVFGSNEREGRLFAILQYMNLNTSMTMASYKTFLRKNFGGAANFVEAAYPLDTYRSATASIAQSYGFTSAETTELAIGDAMAEIIGDSTFKCPAYQGALVTSGKGIPTWSYEFTHNSSCAWLVSLNGAGQQYGWSLLSGIVGPTHTAELPFVFGNLDGQPFGSGTCNSTASEKELSNQMRSLWTAMAENASPSTSAISWTQFSAQGTDAYVPPGLTFANSTASGNIDYSICETWLKVFNYLEYGNLNVTLN